MKRFLFLFLFFPVFAYSATCQYYLVNNPSSKYSTMQELCTAWDGSSPVANPSGGFMCSASKQPIGSSGDCTSCTPDGSSVYSGSVTIRGWASEEEYLSLTEQASAKFTGTTVCANKCLYKYDFLGNGEGDIDTGPITFSGRYTETAQSCTTATKGPVATITGSKGGSNSDVVDSIDTQTKQITDSITSIKDSITSASTNIVNSINTMSASITDALGITNGKLDAVKSAIDSASSRADSNAASLKNSIDSASNRADSNSASLKNSIDSASSRADSNAASLKNSIDSASNRADSNSVSLKNSIDQNTNAVIASGNKIDSSINSLGSKADQSNTFLGDIKAVLNDISSKLDNIFSDEGSDQIEQLGKPTNDPNYTGAVSGATSDFNNLANLLVFQNRACITDLKIDTGMYGEITLPLSEWCDLMALLKLFLHLAVLIYCLKMIQRTVSEL